MIGLRPFNIFPIQVAHPTESAWTRCLADFLYMHADVALMRRLLSGFTVEQPAASDPNNKGVLLMTLTGAVSRFSAKNSKRSKVFKQNFPKVSL